MKILSALAFGIGCCLFIFTIGAATSARAQTTGEIVDVDRLEAKPELKRPLKLRFRKKGVTGEVVLRFIVTAEGKTSDIIIVSFNDPDFVEPAFQAYESAQYTPGMLGGVPVNTRLEVNVTFAAK